MDHTEAKRLGEIIAARLALQGISEREAADRTGIPRSTLKRHLDDGDFSILQLGKLSKVLRLPTSILVQEAESLRSQLDTCLGRSS